jgi:hypothetical protein
VEANLFHAMGMLGASLTSARSGKALSDTPVLEPYRGNPPSGILGRTMETAASFEVRNAPSSYPTIYARLLHELLDSGMQFLVALGYAVGRFLLLRVPPSC